MTKAKRRKAPKRMKDGELSVSYGYTREQGEDYYFTSGDGVPRCDRALMNYFFAALRPVSALEPNAIQKTLIEELESRGYDKTTLRFTIQKAKDQPQEGRKP